MNGVTHPRRFSGGAIAFLLLAALVTKAIRAWDVSHLPSAWTLLLSWPAILGMDLVVCTAFAGLFLLLDRPAIPRLGRGVVTTLCAAWALTLVGNVLSYRLSGGPITLPRLMGEDGGTLADLDLIDPWDLYPMVGLAILLMGGAYSFCAWIGRTRLGPPLARKRVLLFLLLPGIALAAADSLALSRWTFGLGENPVWVFFDDLVARRDYEALALDADAWAALTRPDEAAAVPPESPPEPRTTARNAIIFLAEGIPLKDTSFGNCPEDTTPNALRRSRNGLYFSRYYSTYHKSIHALFSLACSQYPPPSPRTIVQFNPRIACREVSQVLSDHGLASGFFHGGRFKFYDKLSFFGDRGYAILQDAADMKDGDRWEEDRWGIDDRAMVDAALAWIDSLDPSQRFFAFLVPLSPHYPYKPPRDFGHVIPGTDTQSLFLNAIRYSDETFERLMAGLEQRGLADDTVVFWLADHGNYVDEPARETQGYRLCYESNVRVPFLIINPVMFPEPETSSRVGSLIDLAPTMLSLLGLPPEETYVGQDLLAPDWEERRVFLASDRGGRRYVGFVEGDHKFIKEIGKPRTEYYDLVNDPEELTNLSPEFSSRMDEYSTVAETFARAQMTLLQEWPHLEARLSVQQDVLRSGTFLVESEETRAKCRAPNAKGQRPCKGFAGEVSPRIEKKRVGQKQRVCLMTHIPKPSGSVTVTVSGDLLRRVSGVRIGIPDKQAKLPGGKVSITVDVDGERAVTASLTGKHNVAELDFPHAGDRLTVRVSSEDGTNRPVCLMFSDAAWYNRE